MTINIPTDVAVLSDLLKTSLDTLNREVESKKTEIQQIQKQIDLLNAKLSENKKPYNDMCLKEKCLEYFIGLLKSEYRSDHEIAMKILGLSAYGFVHIELYNMYRAGLLREEYFARGHIRYVWNEGIQEFLIEQYNAALEKAKSISGEQKTLF